MYQLDIRNTALNSSPTIKEIIEVINKIALKDLALTLEQDKSENILTLLKTLFITLNTPAKTKNMEAVVGSAKPTKLGAIFSKYCISGPDYDITLPVIRHTFRVYSKRCAGGERFKYMFRVSGISLVINPNYLELSFTSHYGITKDEPIIYIEDLTELEARKIYIVNPLVTLHDIWGKNKQRNIAAIYSFGMEQQKLLLQQGMTVLHDDILSLPPHTYTPALTAVIWEKIIIMTQQTFNLLSLAEVHAFINEYHCPPHIPRMERGKLLHAVTNSYENYRINGDKFHLKQFLNSSLYILSNYVYYLCYERDGHAFKTLLNKIRM